MTPLRQLPAGRVPGTSAPDLGPGALSLNEVYFTIQGECAWMGTPTVFVRTSHCPLRCVWCDSKYTFTDGKAATLDEIMTKVASFPARHVCLTGGEPLAQAGAVPLLKRMTEVGLTVEVETSGSEDIAPIERLAPALRGRVTINLDVKCPGSAMSNFNRWPNLALLRAHDQLKFVLADRGDYDYAKDVLRKHVPEATAWLHPAWGKLEPRVIAEWVKADGLDVRVGVQLHKYIWGDVRGV